MGNSPPSTLLNQEAAVYVRMSTEHQKYSTANQMDVIGEYAKRHGLNIVKIYSDEGKSGLRIQGRNALARLIADVESGVAKFKSILVYDVSRWGRFQDADESAYYEYFCRRAGIAVHYCAEQFENDGSPISTIIKSIKRAMAGEYSRELSAKVFQGARRLIQLGFRMGASPGFGYRRMLVGENGKRKGILQPHEQKYLQTDHVILVPGPAAEVKTVNWIFRQFAFHRRTEDEIATMLNKRGIRNHGNRLWSKQVINDLLLNEKYIGNSVWGRKSTKLKRYTSNPPEMWIRAENAFAAIVPKKLFEAARAVFLKRRQRVSDEEMLAHLRVVLARHGKITGALIDKTNGGRPTNAMIRRRFGGLGAACSLIGYRAPHNCRYKEIFGKRRAQRYRVADELRQHLEAVGGTLRQEKPSRPFIINEELTLYIVLFRNMTTEGGFARWVVEFRRDHRVDLILAVRMNPPGDSTRDYYLFPGTEINMRFLCLAEENGAVWDGYRFETLESLCSIFARGNLELSHEKAY